MMKKILFNSCLFLFCSFAMFAQNIPWVSDMGNSMYQNPVLYTDYSDPDVCRVGKDYYLTASSFNCVPALPILHSFDLVNWTIVNYAIKNQLPDESFDLPRHGDGVYAPSIRFHKNEYYIYYGDPDAGIYMLKTKNPAAQWSQPYLVKKGKGLIDPCPFWDEDGKAYISHAFAGSRAGLNSVLAIFSLSADGKTALDETRIVYDGHIDNPTIEGTKLYKRNGFYYIFAPAGGVPSGWQTVLRSKSIWGPYDTKVVLHTGSTKINGPHQGAWVDTASGEDWFLHFQERKALGRFVHLQPMKWINDWPVIGLDDDGDGCGEPVASYKMPNVGKSYPMSTLQVNDEFNEKEIGLQWQWHANINPLWSFCDAKNGNLRLYSFFQGTNYKNLWDVPNLLLQKFPAPDFTVTTKFTLTPKAFGLGERTGLVVMGINYNVLNIENTKGVINISQNSCNNADKGTAEQIIDSKPLNCITVYLQVEVKNATDCQFHFSRDNIVYEAIGEPFKAVSGKWIGAKIGMFCLRPKPARDGGWVDVDWFRIE